MDQQEGWRDHVEENRAGRIAPQQLQALQDHYTHKDLGLGPVARLLRKDEELGRDLAAGVVAHTEAAIKPYEFDLKQTLVKGAATLAVEFASAMVIGTKFQNHQSGDTSGEDDTTTVELFTADREARLFRATPDVVKAIKEYGAVVVHHLPETGQILSVEPLEVAASTAPLSVNSIEAEMKRAKQANDWFAYRVAERQLPPPEDIGFGPMRAATPEDIVRRWTSEDSMQITFAEDGSVVADDNGSRTTGTWSLSADGHLTTDIFGSTKTYRTFVVRQMMLLRAGFTHRRLDAVDH